MEEITREIVVTGLIQGVGFRPFIFRIASGLNLSGHVLNTSENVIIKVTGAPDKINKLVVELRTQAPPASSVENITVRELDLEHFSGFSILKSLDLSDDVTEISPDINVCEECLADIHMPGHRLDYPFVNCTNCGPRFSIIEQLPYDREKTTMKEFPMCEICSSEYENVSDRRFHAQPVACNHCGPTYFLFSGDKETGGTQAELINRTVSVLDNGGTVLIKGLGGMHLACDAFNENAVKKLRAIKFRDGKPFAVMFRDISALKSVTLLSEYEERALMSWRRPIVLLDLKPDAPVKLAGSVCSGLNRVGAMLPYMPVHSMLFETLRTPAIVLTSGNLSGEPIVIDNDKAREIFKGQPDAFMLHNRGISNRTDDSVVMVVENEERVIRRSRGFVPAPVHTRLHTGGIIAYGAELTSTFCIGKGNKAILSQYIGDLQGFETYTFFEETLEKFKELFRVKPLIAVADLHPEYLSTKAALANENIPVIRVQHHHAHIAACMAENNLDEKVIGIAFDGTGYGTDGHTWGSEFMIADLENFDRHFHFRYLPMPGGDRSTEEPWRMAVAWLYQVYGKDYRKLELPFLKLLNNDDLQIIDRMLETGINCPLTCGAGRFFDAVAGLLGLCLKASFQAEGPMRLEAVASKNIHESYPSLFGPEICLQSTLKAIVEDIRNGVSPQVISAKFHNTIISIIFEAATLLRAESGINKVVLSGGVFQNKIILENCLKILNNNGFSVFSHISVPANDGGIALGQLAVAAKKRIKLCV